MKMTFIVFLLDGISMILPKLYPTLQNFFRVMRLFHSIYAEKRNRFIQKTYSVFVVTNNCSLHSSFNGQTTKVGSTMFPNSGCFAHKKQSLHDIPNS